METLAQQKRRAPRRVLPGFGLTMGITVTYLTLVVLIPLSAVFIRSSGMGWGEFWSAITGRQVVASYKVTFGISFLAAVTNAFFGFIVAWILTRYRFPGRRIFDALVDLPFALPTAVAGIALTALYAPNGWLGRWLVPLGIDIAFTPAGVVVALIFVGLPFVVRTVEPVLADLGAERSIYAPDLPGCGESDPAPDGESTEAAAFAIADFLDSMRIRTVDLLALDGGVAVLRRLALERPAGLRRLVLVAEPGGAAPPASAAAAPWKPSSRPWTASSNAGPKPRPPCAASTSSA
jgi:hypothetical protein